MSKLDDKDLNEVAGGGNLEDLEPDTDDSGSVTPQGDRNDDNVIELPGRGGDQGRDA